MGRRRTMTDEQRVGAIALLEGGLDRDAIATRLGVRPDARRRLHDRWLVPGADAMTQQPRRIYPPALKREAVARYTAGEDSGAGDRRRPPGHGVGGDRGRAGGRRA